MLGGMLRATMGRRPLLYYLDRVYVKCLYIVGPPASDERAAHVFSFYDFDQRAKSKEQRKALSIGSGSPVDLTCGLAAAPESTTRTRFRGGILRGLPNHRRQPTRSGLHTIFSAYTRPFLK